MSPTEGGKEKEPSTLNEDEDQPPLGPCNPRGRGRLKRTDTFRHGHHATPVCKRYGQYRGRSRKLQGGLRNRRKTAPPARVGKRGKEHRGFTRTRGDSDPRGTSGQFSRSTELGVTQLAFAVGTRGLRPLATKSRPSRAKNERS